MEGETNASNHESSNLTGKLWLGGGAQLISVVAVGLYLVSWTNMRVYSFKGGSDGVSGPMLSKVKLI